VAWVTYTFPAKAGNLHPFAKNFFTAVFAADSMVDFFWEANFFSF